MGGTGGEEVEGEAGACCDGFYSLDLQRFGLGARGQPWGDAPHLSPGMLHPLFPRAMLTVGIFLAVGSPSFPKHLRRGLKAAIALAFPGQDPSRHVGSTFRSSPHPTPGAQPAPIHFFPANSHTAQSPGLIQRARAMPRGRIRPRWEPALKESKLFPVEKAQYCPTVSPTGTG